MTDPTTPGSRRPYLKHYDRDRARRPAMQFQPRDFALLEAVWDNRFATLSLLRELFPPDPDRAPAHKPATRGPRSGTTLANRLKLLFQHGYLDRIRSVRGGELVYALADAGAKLLRDRQPRLPIPDTDWREKNRTVSPLFVDHALMIARVRLALTLATRDTPTVELDTFLPEARAPRHRWPHHGQEAYVNPDAFFTLRETDRPGPAERAAYFVEADRSTMALKRLRQKYAFYSALRAARLHREPPFRLPGFRVLTVCRSNERALHLLKLVAAADSPVLPDHRAMFLFTTEETYLEHPQNILAAVWRSGDDPMQPRALIASPLPRL